MRTLIGYVIDDDVYCTDDECVPKDVDLDDDHRAVPLYDSDEWVDHDAACCKCHKGIK
jgi:hypothetical protein